MIPPGACISDAEMDQLVRSSQFNNYDSGDSGSENPRRPQMPTTKTMVGGGVGTQRLRMSAIAYLKEFSGRDKDEDRARSWMSKVKSAFLRDQVPDEKKCLVLAT